MFFIYSGISKRMDSVLLNTLGKNHIITIIPTCPDDISSAKLYSKELMSSGLRTRVLRKEDYMNKELLETNILLSNSIYLIGGNTFDFNSYANKMGLGDIISKFISNGGVVCCESAGSIILSPTIAMAVIPTRHKDEQPKAFVKKGLNLLPFHISPHFEENEQDIKELQSFSNITKQKVVLLKDGDGLIFHKKIKDIVGTPATIVPQRKSKIDFDIQSKIPKWCFE